MIQSYSPSTYPRRPAKVGKTIEKWILYLVVLGIAGVALYWFITGRGKTFEVSLSSKKGTVEYRENEKDGWKPADSIPLKINVSTEIRTLADSEATFTLGDESKMRLGSYSRIVMAGNRGEINWVQTDGSSHHQTANNPDRKSYKVSISDGVVETQGTAFEVKIKESDTSILVFENQIKITYKDKETASAKAGEEILINPVGRKNKEIDSQELQESWTLANLKEDVASGLPIDGNILAKAGIDAVVQDSSNEAEDSTNQESTNAKTDENQGSENPDISLEAKQSTNGILLSWTGGPDGRESWKVLKGGGAEITYPNDSYRTVPKDATSYLWEMSGDTNSYYYRLCAFRADNSCAAYSNSVNVSFSGNASSSNNVSATDSGNAGTQNQTTTSNAKSGVTSRKNCENSGGHWTKSSGVCKCPAKEVFVASVGRCQKK